jgi:ElaA protein
MLTWIFKRFEELSLQELYDALKLRQMVFIVEQTCIFPDIDGLDAHAYHLLGYDDKKIVAYTRITFPGVMFDEVSIGRIVTDTQERNKGYGKEITAMALQKVKEIYGNVPVKIAAQDYLLNFYGSFGFKPVDEKYMWDGILHQDMLLDAS